MKPPHQSLPMHTLTQREYIKSFAIRYRMLLNLQGKWEDKKSLNAYEQILELDLDNAMPYDIVTFLGPKAEKWIRLDCVECMSEGLMEVMVLASRDKEGKNDENFYCLTCIRKSAYYLSCVASGLEPEGNHEFDLYKK